MCVCVTGTVCVFKRIMTTFSFVMIDNFQIEMFCERVTEACIVKGFHYTRERMVTVVRYTVYYNNAIICMPLFTSSLLDLVITVHLGTAIYTILAIVTYIESTIMLYILHCLRLEGLYRK